MIAPRILVATLLLGALGFTTNAPPTQPSPPLDDEIGKGVYIAELEKEGDIQGFLDQVQLKLGGNVSRRLDLDYSLFKGVSFQVEGSGQLVGGDTGDSIARRMMAELPRVKKLWPVRRVGPPRVRVAWTGKDKSFGGNKLDTNNKKDPYAPHVMTQIDKMHERGFTGNGTRIGVVDTGIDYTHPALGSCFGPGCLVGYGRDLYDGDDDPMDECVGHGTHVAGIIAAQSNTLGFIGAAPDVTLGAYRIFPCGNDGTTSDMVIAGFNQAFEDGSDIITASLGLFSGWAEDAVAVAVSRIAEAGVPCTVAIGNQVGGTEGMFGDSAPASGRGGPNLVSASPLRDPDPSWAPQNLALAGPVTQQGGGLVQALDAATATILVSKSNLSFNDSEHFASEQIFTVTNSGLEPIGLNLTHLPAFTTSALYQIYRSSTPIPSELHATLTISPSALSLDPGASTNVRVRTVPPRDVDSTILPVYSGYVVLSATDGTRLSLPYLGAATAMRNQTVMASERMWLTRSDSARSEPVTANATFQLALPAGAPKEWLVNATNATTSPEGYIIYAPGTKPSQYVWLVLGSALLRVEFVRLDGAKVPGGGLVGSTVSGFPREYNRAAGWTAAVDGTLADGSYLEPGRYKSVVLALRIFGDAQNLQDYDSYESPAFWIRYVRG